MSDYVERNPNDVIQKEIEREDPYKYIRGQERKLTLFQRIRRNIGKFCRFIKKDFDEMKDIYWRLTKAFGIAFLILGGFILVISQIGHGFGIDDGQTIIEASSDEENEEDEEEEEKEKDEEFIPKVETPVLDSATLIGQEKRYNKGLEK